MPLDIAKLDAALEVSAVKKAAKGLRGGRRQSGAFAAVRDNLAALERLSENHEWNEIAAALAKQGVLKRDGTPLSGKALTALIASVRRQANKRAGDSRKRRSRSDLTHDDQSVRTRAAGSETLTSTQAAQGKSPDPRGRTAEEIRRAEYERSQRFVKSKA